MGASMVAGVILVEVAGTGVACKYHIACTIGNAIVWVRGNIFKELMGSVSGGLGGRGLLGADGAESDKINRASIPQEDAGDTLDAFDAGHVEWRAQIGRSRLLGLGAVGDGRILVQGCVCSGLGGCVLLVYDGTESNKKFIVDCASVPQEGTNNILDAFDAGRVEWRAQIGRSRLLGLGAVGDGRILVRG